MNFGERRCQSERVVNSDRVHKTGEQTRYASRGQGMAHGLEKRKPTSDVAKRIYRECHEPIVSPGL